MFCGFGALNEASLDASNLSSADFAAIEVNPGALNINQFCKMSLTEKQLD